MDSAAPQKPPQRLARADGDVAALASVLGQFTDRSQEISRHERELIGGYPGLSAVFDALQEPQEARRARERQEIELLLRSDAQAFERHLIPRGRLFAQLQLRFEAWWSCMQLTRRAMRECFASTANDDTATLLRGIDTYFEFASSALALGYAAAKEQELAKVESERDVYVSLFRNAPVGMLLYEWLDASDPGSFRLLAANPKAAQVGSAPIPEHVGRTLRETSPHVLQTHVPHRYAAAVEAGETSVWSIENLGRVHDVRSFPVRGRYLGVIFDDVTLQREMQAALDRQLVELERSNRELDAFAYVASHDLKAPLRDIDNLANWVADDAGAQLPAGARRHLSLLQDRVLRMERLLDDLLDYSRAGRVNSVSDEFPVSFAIDDALQLAAVPPSFTVQIKGPSPIIRAPRVALAQVLRNLVQNAVKHHHRKAGRIEIRVTDSAERIECAVCDDGPGIAPEFHERVFRMFQTLRPRDEVEGSGIGLAIVKKLVESHGGSVHVVSDGASGTTICFTWPKRWPRPIKEA